MSTELKTYRKKGTQPMQPWTAEIDMKGVSISDADKLNGSPRAGDMIALNPKDSSDRWLVAEAWFKANYEEVESTPEPELEDPYIVWASGEILTRAFPNELFGSEQEESEWMLHYVRDTYEHLTLDQIYTKIESLADSVRGTFNFKEVI